ncbi:MAG: ABC transporter permease subunit [Acidimicrobiales bacterium]
MGLCLASVFGLIVGIGRLSSNWLVNKLATLYVEVLRNIPPLVIIIFFGAAVFTYGPLPIFSEAKEIKLPGTDNNLLMLSNERIGIPSIFGNANMGLYWILLALAVVAVFAVRRWRQSVNDKTGAPDRKLLWSLGTFFGIAILGYIALGRPFSMSWPALSENRRLVENGFTTNSGYWSLTLALALYTGSHLAEIIRGSIQAVAKGQSEASNALALSGFQRYRFVILPQALRIAIPSGINQFLNLVKNTSLGTVVAFPEITALVKTLIGNGKPALEGIAVAMLIYLSFSLAISAILNVVNNKLQIVGR